MTLEEVELTIAYCEGRISALEFTLRPEARRYDKNRADKNQLKLELLETMLKASVFMKEHYLATLEPEEIILTV